MTADQNIIAGKAGAHPWRRAGARLLDSFAIPYLLVTSIGWALSALSPAVALLVLSDPDALREAVLLPVVAIPLNAALSGSTGGTLGKWLFRLRLYDENGGPIGLPAAVIREMDLAWWVWGFGYFPWIRAGVRLSRPGPAWWDARRGRDVIASPMGWFGWIGAILVTGFVAVVVVASRMYAVAASQAALGA